MREPEFAPFRVPSWSRLLGRGLLPLAHMHSKAVSAGVGQFEGIRIPYRASFQIRPRERGALPP
jgi:hypothetical protein